MYNDRGYNRGYGRPRSTNSLLDFNTYNPEYIGRPIEAIESMAAHQSSNTQQLMDSTSALDIAMSNININPLDEGGQNIKNQQLQAFREGVSAITQGDYQMAGAGINKIKSDFVKNKGLQTAVENQASYTANREALTEAYDKDKLSDAQYRDAMTQPAANTQVDEFGIYNKFTPNQYVTKYDYNADISKYTNAFNKRVDDIGMTDIIGADGTKRGYKQGFVSRVDTEQLAKGIDSLIESNPDMKAFLQQEAKLTGRDYDTFVDKIIEGYTTQKSGQDRRTTSTIWKPSTRVDSKAATRVGTRLYGIGRIMNNENSNILKNILPEIAGQDSDGIGSPGHNAIKAIGTAYNWAIGENHKGDERYKNITDEGEIAMLRNMAIGIGGMDANTNIGDLTDAERKGVFKRIGTFYEQVTNNNHEEINANVSFVNMYTDTNRRKNENNTMFGSESGLLIDKNGVDQSTGVYKSFGKYLDYETGEEIPRDELLDGLDSKNVRGLVLGNTNYANPISTIANDHSFADSKLLQFTDGNGNVKLVYAGLPIGNVQSLNKESVDKSMLYSSFYKSGITNDVTLNNKRFTIMYNPNITSEAGIRVGGFTINGNTKYSQNFGTVEDIYDNIYNKQQ